MKIVKYIIFISFTIIINSCVVFQNTTIFESLENYKTNIIVQNGHSASISNISYSPDGKYFATSSWDNTVKLWDASTGNLIRDFIGHSKYVSTVLFSPNGKYIASGSDDKTVKLWDIHTGKIIKSFSEHSYNIKTIMFSSNGKYIFITENEKNVHKLWEIDTGRLIKTFKEGASISDDSISHNISFIYDTNYFVVGINNKLKLFDINSGNEIKELTTHLSDIELVNCSINSRYIISSSYEYNNDSYGYVIKLYDLLLKKEVNKFKGEKESFDFITFSPNNKYIFTHDTDKNLKIWNVGTGKLINNIKTKEDFITNISFSSDNKYFIPFYSYSKEKVINIFEVSTGKLIKTLKIHNEDISFVSFDPNKNFITIGDFSGEIKIWNLDSNNEIKRINSSISEAIDEIFFSKDFKYLFTLTSKKLRVWDIKTGEITKNINIETFPFSSSISISPDLNFLIMGGRASDNPTIKIIDLNNGIVVKTISSIFNSDFKFSLDGKYLLANTNSNLIKIWEFESGKEVVSITDYNQILDFSYNNNETYIVSGNRDGKIKLWDLNTGNLIKYIEAHNDSVYSVKFSPNGKYVVSGSDDKTVKLWDFELNKEIKTFNGHTGGITEVCFNSSSEYIASGAYDNTIRLWNINLEGEVKTLYGHSKVITGVLFNSNGKYILSSSGDGKIKIWDINSGKELLTLITYDNEWIAYTPDGYFDSSEKSRKLIYWVEGMKNLPIDKYEKKFYVPNLLKKIMNEERIGDFN